MPIYQSFKRMLMYDVLAQHYDSLVKDDLATERYVTFVKTHITGRTLMELACGSGELALALAKSGYRVAASDQSMAMLDVAKAKDVNQEIDYTCMDMTTLQGIKDYDGICCFCDSINYLEEAELLKMLAAVYEHLQPQGVFLFDMHSMDRLEEFKEPYYEAGVVDGVAYTWNIQSEGYRLYHNFIFYDERQHPTYENHVQTVFEPQKVYAALCTLGFQVDIYTDFEKVGIQEGEKYFFVCQKGCVG